MESLLEGIAQRIATLISGTTGTNVFIGVLPDEDPDTNVGASTVAIFATGGVEPDRDLPVAKPTIQVMVRSTDHELGMARMEEIYLHFHQLRDGADFPNGVSIMRVYAINEPQQLEIDEKERHIFTVTFVFQYRRT